MKQYKNFVFDVDGTLIDSVRDITNAQIWALRQLGVEEYTQEDLYKYFGKPLFETFGLILPEELHDRIPEAVVMYREYYKQRWFETTTLFAGVTETLGALRSMDAGLATATTKSTETTISILTHYDVARFFHQIQGMEDDMPHKPDPFILNKVLTERSWRAEETLMVGDTDKDIMLGRNAGVDTCGVTYGCLSRAELASFGADHIVDNFSELLPLLSRS
ncbi:MAG TPA: HAD-IA family hydrolase [Bacteroidota bacterium]|nr:HAD-IA family hydrolase [Bacteroidota bacterium]